MGFPEGLKLVYTTFNFITYFRDLLLSIPLSYFILLHLISLMYVLSFSLTAHLFYSVYPILLYHMNDSTLCRLFRMDGCHPITRTPSRQILSSIAATENTKRPLCFTRLSFPTCLSLLA